MMVERIDGRVWVSMAAPQKLELVRCYAEDLAEAAASAGTTIQAQEEGFVSWLDEEFPRGELEYFVGRIDAVPVTLLRVHRDEVPGELLIEALQTVPAHQRRGLAGQLLRHVVTAVPGRYCADVHVANAASRAAFASVGFTRVPCPS
ncbi:MAG: GNAT family N-acetyltransferase, partial [Propionibacteriaceae bacterium]|nr:GNAT family N-acetyltransferase [Propionibacteriaceae bacterium]